MPPENAPSISFRARPCGSTPVCHRCPSAGCWSKSPTGRSHPKHCSAPTKQSHRSRGGPFSSSAGRSKRPLKKRAPIWVWKRNGRGMTRPLRGARPWCWPYSRWWRSWRIPSAKKQPVASDKLLGIAKQNPLFRMHWLGCENTSGNIFQGQLHTQTGKNQPRQSSNALSISFAMLLEGIKSS